MRVERKEKKDKDEKRRTEGQERGEYRNLLDFIVFIYKFVIGILFVLRII